MKKSIILAAVALLIGIAASAQPKAIGLRLGYYNAVSYEHYLGGDNFIEANGGIYGNSGGVSFFADGIYNFTIAHPDWTPRGEWGFYAGPGLTLGTWANGGNASFDIGICGQVGLEYTFWFPLNLSFDLRPRFGFISRNFDPLVLVPCLSVRYAF
ncbi:MAG: hypothetical protein IJ795_07925 [Bacteroidales bacterium]|nr:hypothetical protein [Bacteroidales bacterium]